MNFLKDHERAVRRTVGIGEQPDDGKTLNSDLPLAVIEDRRDEPVRGWDLPTYHLTVALFSQPRSNSGIRGLTVAAANNPTMARKMKNEYWSGMNETRRFASPLSRKP